MEEEFGEWDGGLNGRANPRVWLRGGALRGMGKGKWNGGGMLAYMILWYIGFGEMILGGFEMNVKLHARAVFYMYNCEPSSCDGQLKKFKKSTPRKDHPVNLCSTCHCSSFLLYLWGRGRWGFNPSTYSSLLLIFLALTLLSTRTQPFSPRRSSSVKLAVNRRRPTFGRSLRYFF